MRRCPTTARSTMLLVDYFPSAMRKHVQARDRRPPAAPRDHRHRAGQPHRQPAWASSTRSNCRRKKASGWPRSAPRSSPPTACSAPRRSGPSSRPRRCPRRRGSMLFDQSPAALRSQMADLLRAGAGRDACPRETGRRAGQAAWQRAVGRRPETCSPPTSRKQSDAADRRIRAMRRAREARGQGRAAVRHRRRGRARRRCRATAGIDARALTALSPIWARGWGSTGRRAPRR